MQEIIEKYVPNWVQYKQIFPKNTENIKFMENSLLELYKLGKLQEIGKKINVEIGIFILNKKEIDDKIRKLLLKIFSDI